MLGSKTLPTLRRFQRPEVPKRLAYYMRVSSLPSWSRVSTPWTTGLTPPHIAPSMGAFRRLSYPLTPSFPRCQHVQVSPQCPAAFLRPQKPTSVEHVQLFRYWPRPGLSPGFANDQEPGAFPPQARVHVAQHRPQREWIEKGISAPSVRCSMASSITSTTLRRARWAWRPSFFDVCVLAGFGGPPGVAEGGGLSPFCTVHGRCNEDRGILCFWITGICRVLTLLLESL